ncbi:hypothetical protein ACE3MQ_16900 [Paenibacillus lentus]|uniref:hypothetical protein n=1 Tax=Paenibacillus lentus TaxID=1338368 RepID=UPI003667F548
MKNVTLVVCLAHARKYNEALKVSLDAKGNPNTIATQGLSFCNQLFAIKKGQRSDAG